MGRDHGNSFFFKRFPVEGIHQGYIRRGVYVQGRIPASPLEYHEHLKRHVPTPTQQRRSLRPGARSYPPSPARPEGGSSKIGFSPVL